MAFIVRRPWDGQPQEPAGIDRSNPASRDLRAVIGASPDLFFDFTGLNRITAIASPAVKATSRGMAMSLTSAGGLFLPSGPTVNLPVAHSISAWVYITSTPTFHTFVEKGTSGVDWPAYSFGIGQTATGQQRFGYSIRAANASPNVEVEQVGYIVTTGWFHVVVTHDGSTLSLYINGKIDNSAAGNASAPYANTSRLFIGGIYNSTPAYSSKEATYPLQDVRLYGRCLKAAEVAADYADPRAVFAPRRVYIPGAAAGGPGAQSLTPTLYSNAQTFYTPTVSTGAVSLAPALYSNAQTFYAPTVTRGAVSLAPTLYSNAQAFYSATVTQGAVLAPALYSNSQAFYAPTVSAGAVTLTPALYSNAQSFYSATVLNAGQILAPGLYSNAQAFYAPTVGVGAVTLTPALFTNSSTFYAASVSDGSASAFIKYFDVLSGKLLILRAL